MYWRGGEAGPKRNFNCNRETLGTRTSAWNFFLKFCQERRPIQYSAHLMMTFWTTTDNSANKIAVKKRATTHLDPWQIFLSQFSSRTIRNLKIDQQTIITTEELDWMGTCTRWIHMPQLMRSYHESLPSLLNNTKSKHLRHAPYTPISSLAWCISHYYLATIYYLPAGVEAECLMCLICYFSKTTVF